MNFLSTRGASPALGFSAALAMGLAPDGGLYVPRHIPRLDAEALPADCAANTLSALLAPLLASGDPLRPHLPALCAEACDFPLPLKALGEDRAWLLELFHGRTAAFKDLAAGFLAAALSRLRAIDAPAQTVLVATSGDTGAAVAAAFHRRPGFRVVVLYPEGRVSPAQAHSLGAFGDNVQAVAVQGSFDDCQRLVKQALADIELRAQAPLLSANSISLGRWLPQMAYYAWHALRFQRTHGESINLIVPTGNLGNAMAALLARAMGLPIGEIRLATNANPTLDAFARGSAYTPRDAIATLANAMDVGAPSNFERLRWLAGGEDRRIRELVRVQRVDDERIRATLAEAEARHGTLPCPHTACGLAVLEDLRGTGDARPWLVAATAHPSKFTEVVAPYARNPITPPAAFAALLAKPSEAATMAADSTALASVLRG